MGATASIAQGAGEGAAAGSSAGPIGTGIGAVIGGAIGYLGRSKKPKTPSLAQFSPPNTAAQEAAANAAGNAAAAQQAQRAKSAQGRGSTILTGPQGLPAAPVVASNTALGL